VSWGFPAVRLPPLTDPLQSGILCQRSLGLGGFGCIFHHWKRRSFITLLGSELVPFTFDQPPGRAR